MYSKIVSEEYLYIMYMNIFKAPLLIYIFTHVDFGSV